MGSEQIMRKVKVEGGNLRFSSAHFITFGGKCERLHGHNYGVLVEIEGTLTEGAAARGDTHIGAGQTGLCPIVLIGAHSATRPEQCGKGANQDHA